jgi:hypothetical protein
MNPDNPLEPSFPRRRESSENRTPRSGQHLNVDPLRGSSSINWIPACAGMTGFRPNGLSGMNGVYSCQLFRCFYLEYQQLLPGINSDAVRRNFGALLVTLDIFHAVRGKSVWSGNSETLSRKSGGVEEKRTIRKFQIVSLEATLRLISYLPRRIFT